MKKNKIGTIVVILITLVLAGIAIFTAIRLYQLRQQPVAPNAPTSQPQAAVPPPPSCSLSFALVATPSPSPTPPPIICSSKVAYRDVAANTAGNYDTSSANRLANNATVTPGQKIVYEVTAGPPNRAGAYTITDTLSSKLTFLDAIGACQYNSTDRKVTCTMSNTGTTAKYRVTVNSGATGTIGNTATVLQTGGAGSNCTFSLVVQGSTPTPSPSPTPTGTPTSTPTAPPTGTPVPTPTPTTPPGCNSTCTSNTQCTESMICYIPAGATSGNCRNPSCQTSTNCICATATPLAAGTPPPSLPESGVDWPTYVGAGLGIFVIIASLILAL